MKTFLQIKKMQMKQILMKISSLALMVGIISLNLACFGIFYQPKVPNSIEKFTKI